MEKTTTQERHLTATIAVSDLPTDMHGHQLHTELIEAGSEEELLTDINKYFGLQEDMGHETCKTPLHSLNEADGLDVWDEEGTRHYLVDIWPAKEGESGRTVWTAAVSFTTEDDPMPHTDIITAASGGRLLEDVNAYLEDAGDDLLPGLRLEKADEFMNLEYTNEKGTIQCTITVKKSTI